MGPTVVYSNNMACVNCAHNTTTQRLRYLQMQEKAVLEVVKSNFASVHHVGGKSNIANILTKKDRGSWHCIEVRDQVMLPLFSSNHNLVGTAKTVKNVPA
eukprot:14361880-Ditylum_brightwellii.AAC.1